MASDTRRAFTLIELVMVIAILGILAVPGAYLMAYLIQNSVFIPNKLNVDMIGRDVMDAIIEGDPKAPGLRYARVISAASNNSAQFKNADNQTVVFLWDPANNKMIRTINGGAQETIPYYFSGNISIINIASNPIFTYYDSGEAVTAAPASVRRVEVAFRVNSGTGNYSDWQGSSDHFSSVAVRKYE